MFDDLHSLDLQTGAWKRLYAFNATQHAERAAELPLPRSITLSTESFVLFIDCSLANVCHHP